LLAIKQRIHLKRAGLYRERWRGTGRERRQNPGSV
jgi:hypothetical protein